MQYDDDTITRAGDFAALLLTDEQLSQLLGVPLPALRTAVRLPDCRLGNAIRNGRLKTAAELNKHTIGLAVRGSASAQATVAQMLKAVNT